jgi:hypothetical protein
MSINKDRFRALPIKERAALINTYVSGGVMDLAEMKRHYNSFAPGGPIETDEYGYPADITPAVVEADYPREAEVIKRADASNADMVQRLKQGSSRVTIPDWEDPKKVATHKMMSAGNYVVGNVQNINGQLFDFTDPKHGFKDPDRAAINSAIERGDYIKFDTEGDARYFAEHYKKYYNSFGPGGRLLDGTETEQTITAEPPKKLMSKEEYLNEQRKAVIESSLDKSKSRKMPTIPYILWESEDDWYKRMTNAIKLYKNILTKATESGDIKLIKSSEEMIRTAENELNSGFKPQLVEGASCIYTATDNYGRKYRVSGNQTFRANPNKYGFEEISLNELAPGDIVQDFSSRDNMPHHAITFVGYDENGKALFNYSKGGSTEEDIVINGHYPFILDDENPRVHLDGVNNDKLKHSAAAYRFVGTKEDNEKWNNDYYDYRRSYDKDWLEEAKRVINILPTTLLAPSPTIVTSKTIKSNGGRINKFFNEGRILEGTKTKNQTTSNMPPQAAGVDILQQKIHPLSPLGLEINSAKAEFNHKYRDIPKEQLPFLLDQVRKGILSEFVVDGKATFVKRGQPIQDATSSIMEYAPAVGDLYEVGEIINDVKEGDYKEAALAAALLLLPGNVSKAIPENKVVNAVTDYSKLTDGEWDDLYFKAVKENNLDEVKRLREAHFTAKSAGNQLVKDGTPMELYHFSDKKFNSVDPSKFGSNDPGFYGKGFYTTPDLMYGKTYGPNQHSLYGYSQSPFRTNGDVTRSGASFNFNRPEEMPFVDDVNLLEEVAGADASWQQGSSFFRSDKPIEEVVFPGGERLKFSDPIVYDDAGNIIPLSQRDNFDVNDFRYKNGGRLKNLSIYRKLDGKSSNNQTVSGNKAQTGYSEIQVGLPKEESINVPMYTYRDRQTSLEVPLEEAERAFGFYRDVMPSEAIPSAEELQNIANEKIILSDIKDDWKDHVNDDDVESLFGIISDDTQRFIGSLLIHSPSYIKGNKDVSDTINITAPNTDISKFIFGNKISKDAIEEISRVAKLRNQDPYDILAHMLIEVSGSNPLRTHSYYNTHDVIQRQINPSLYNNYTDPDTILKQLGIYNGKKIPNINVIKKAYEKVKTKRNEAIKNLKVPESSIDAVALRMLLHGRDFNPAQKGLKCVWAEGEVKNTYLDMIDSAIKSLKENMPDLFK